MDVEVYFKGKDEPDIFKDRDRLKIQDGYMYIEKTHEGGLAEDVLFPLTEVYRVVQICDWGSVQAYKDYEYDS